MPRKKQQSREERLAKAKIARRNRYAKIKADPVLYALEKEKERQRYKKRREQKKLLSVEEMTPRARRLQRKKWRENFRKHFQKKKLIKAGIKHINENTPSSSDSEGNSNDNENRSMRLHPICENEPQPSTSNDLYEPLVKNLRCKLRRYIIEKKDQMYKSQLESLQRKNNAYRKIIIRLRKRLQSPNSKVTALLRDKTREKEAKKKILFGEAMRNTLQTNYKNKNKKKEKREFSDAVIGDKLILKNLKVLSETNNFRVRDNMKNTNNQRNVEYEKLKSAIQNFFERDDISRATSGKKEFITKKKKRKQKRYLLDTMKNLHKIFETEFCKVSYSYFCKQRPFWVHIHNGNQRDILLVRKNTVSCQNLALTDLIIQFD